jgi:RNA polymerase subunit RPABC4/transcription elongation factor Spt4
VDEVDSNQLREALQGATMITCWNCGRDYNHDYDSCPYCGSYPHTASGLPRAVVTANQISEAYQGATMIQCARCGQFFNSNYDSCPYCGWMP